MPEKLLDGKEATGYPELFATKTRRHEEDIRRGERRVLVPLPCRASLVLAAPWRGLCGE